MKTKQKQKQKRQKERNQNTKHMPEKDTRGALDKESLVYRQPRAVRYPPDRNYLVSFAPKGNIASITLNSVLSGFQVYSLSAQSTPLWESLGRSDQRGSKTSQACYYSHPRCNLNLAVRRFRFSLALPAFGRIFLFLHPSHGHKPTAPFTYCAIPDPRVKCGGSVPVPRDAK